MYIFNTELAEMEAIVEIEADQRNQAVARLHRCLQTIYRFQMIKVVSALCEQYKDSLYAANLASAEGQSSENLQEANRRGIKLAQMQKTLRETKIHVILGKP